jgi:LIVCS family branched-chain amino acid:cation transporter
MSGKQNSGVIAAGLALFSMFFGAGDLLWPLILGGTTGDKNLYAMLGLLITGVSLPLLGLISMMLFEGDYRAFFGRIGALPSFILILIVQVILGPLGSIPRLITLSHATLKVYLPESFSLVAFSVVACLIILAFTIKPQKVISILGLILSPFLLLTLGAILVLGFISPPEPAVLGFQNGEAFKTGLKVGYNTLDLIASFIFAPFVMSHFLVQDDQRDPKEARKAMLKKMLKASLMAAALLSCMYIGLTYVAAFYTPYLDPSHLPEERLSAISMYLLGPYGGMISCAAVALTCLTSAIPLTSICADYIRKDLLKEKSSPLVALIITLFISSAVANLGFMGIAGMLAPALEILCPGLIVLSVLNLFHKLFETKVPKIPVFATFALSTLGRFVL